MRDSDGTIIFTLASELAGGSKRTAEFAEKHKKPVLHVHRGIYQPDVAVQEFINTHGIRILNIAGSRENKETGIQQWVKELLNRSLFWSEFNPNMLGGSGEG